MVKGAENDLGRQRSKKKIEKITVIWRTFISSDLSLALPTRKIKVGAFYMGLGRV